MRISGWPGDAGYAFATSVEAWRREQDEARHEPAALDDFDDERETPDEADNDGRGGRNGHAAGD